MSEPTEAAEVDFWGEIDPTDVLQRYRTLVNTVDNGIYQLDAQGRFVAINETTVEMTGYARDELLGEPASLLLDEDDVARIDREIRRRLATDGSESSPFEFTIRTKTGEEIVCELQLSLLVDDGDFRGRSGSSATSPTGNERSDASRSANSSSGASAI